MRNESNDRPFNIYELGPGLTPEGYSTEIATLTRTDMPADMQPVGGKVNFEAYGIDKVAAEAQRLFCDAGEPVNIGSIVRDNTSLKTYIVKGLRLWYTHTEAIMEPMRVVV
jgi:hypothetical protein